MKLGRWTSAGPALAALAMLAAIPTRAAAQERAPLPAERVGPERSLELSVSDQTVWLGFRTELARGIGHLSLGALVNEDDDFALQAGLMRYTQVRADLPLSLGVGVAGYATVLDRPDEEAYAIALVGAAEYAFPTTPPTRASVELAYAPDVTTFDGGDRLLDFVTRYEVDIGEHASAFVGFRLLEVDLERSSDYEIEDRLHLGVRLTL